MKKHTKLWTIAMVMMFLLVFLLQKRHLAPKPINIDKWAAPLDLPAANFDHEFRGNPLLVASAFVDPLLNPDQNGRPPHGPLDLFAGLDDNRLATTVSKRPLARPIPIGELLRYNILWNGIHVGELELTTQKVTADKSLVRAAARVRSNSVVETIYPVDNLFESILAKSSGSTRRYRKDQSEGDHQRIDLIEVDTLVNVARYRKFKRGELRRDVTYDVVARPTDPLGLFYILRSFETDVNGSINLPLLNNKRMTDVKLDRHQDKTVEVPLGKFDCMVWMPDTKELYDDNPDASATLYFERNTRIPIKVRAKLPSPIGTVSIVLVKWVKGE